MLQRLAEHCAVSTEPALPILGPPGTGKTTIIVHALLSLRAYSAREGHSRFRCLITARTNAATVMLLGRFHAVLEAHNLSRDALLCIAPP